MKNRLFLSFFAAAGLMSLAACSSDDDVSQQNLKTTTSAITVQLPDNFGGTRASTGGTNSALSGYQNTSKATIYLSMYDKDGTKVLWKGSKPAADGKATFNPEGIPGQKVKFVGYATVGDKTLSSDDLTQIPVTNTLNDEEGDGFSGAIDGVFADTQELTLTRPNCKVRLVATDWPTAADAGVTVNKVEVTSNTNTYLLPYSQLTALTSTYGTAATTSTLSAEALPSYTNETAQTSKTIFVDYIPVNADPEIVNTPLTVNVTYTVDGNQRTRTINVSNVPVKRNRLITISGKVFVQSSEFTVYIDDQFGTEYDSSLDNNIVTTTYNVKTAEELQKAIDVVNTVGAKNTNITLTSDVDMTGVTYNSPRIDGYQGTQTVVIDGKGHKITGLTQPLVKYTWSNVNLTIKDLTIDNSDIEMDVNDANEDTGVGAVIGYISCNPNITIDNVHVTNTTVKGGHWTGGIYGYAAGYSTPNNGPVFTEVAINNCSVENCTIEGKGSVGAVAGHATGDVWTSVKINNSTFTGNTSTSTGTSKVKAGLLIGTVGAAGTEAYGKTGGVWFTGCTLGEGNTAFSGGEQVYNIFGRYGVDSGRLYWDGTEGRTPTFGNLTHVTVGGQGDDGYSGDGQG